MKRLSRILGFITAILLVLILSLPSSAKATEQPSYPSSIGGLPVLYVENSTNTFGLASDEVNLVLLDVSSSSPEESLTKAHLSDYLLNNPLPSGWSISLYGGKGASKGSFNATHQYNDQLNRRLFNKFGSITLSEPDSPGTITPSTNIDAIPIGRSDSKTMFSSDVLATGYTDAIENNTDPAGSQTITTETVWITAPTVGNEQDEYSYLGLNGKTNGPYYLQVGQMYATDPKTGEGVGQNIYTDTYDGLHPKPFMGLTYVPGNSYEYEIAYVSTLGKWLMACYDETNDLWYSQLDTYSSGNKLVSPKSDVYFENHNANPQWYNGFTNPINAYSAQDNNGQWKNWDGSSTIIIDVLGHQVTNDGVITGTLQGGSACSWNLDKILLTQCEFSDWTETNSGSGSTVTSSGLQCFTGEIANSYASRWAPLGQVDYSQNITVVINNLTMGYESLATNDNCYIYIGNQENVGNLTTAGFGIRFDRNGINFKGLVDDGSSLQTTTLSGISDTGTIRIRFVPSRAGTGYVYFDKYNAVTNGWDLIGTITDGLPTGSTSVNCGVNP